MRRFVTLGLVAFLCLAACGEARTQERVVPKGESDGLDCRAEGDSIYYTINELDPFVDSPDDPGTALEEYLRLTPPLEVIPFVKFDVESGDPGAHGKGAEVTFTAEDDSVKVAEATLTNLGKDDWGVGQISICQSFIDKYKSFQR